MNEESIWYVKTDDGNVYGPSTREALVGFARDGRIQPSSFVSRDRITWIPAQMMPELEMKWLIEAQPGKFFGPFNRQVVIQLVRDGSAPKGAKIYALHEYAPDEDPPPKIVEKVIEKVVEKVVEVEKIVEKIVEVEPPPRTEVVVPEVVEPVSRMPPPSRKGSIFGNLDRNSLAALEAAAERELAKSGRLSKVAGLFGRKS